MQGRPGKRGQPGRAAPHEIIDRISAELADVQHTLRIQFERIARLQASLDDLRLSVSKPVESN
jgi:hypothetical protein